jgi:hypothetical protein
MRYLFCLLLLLVAPLVRFSGAAGPPAPREKVLFDFESPGDLEAWSNLTLPGAA